MLLYPEAMRKAQAEIDSIVRQGRLPGFSDSGLLPYMQALIKETTRYILLLCIFLVWVWSSCIGGNLLHLLDSHIALWPMIHMRGCLYRKIAPFMPTYSMSSSRLRYRTWLKLYQCYPERPKDVPWSQRVCARTTLEWYWSQVCYFQHAVWLRA